MMKKAVLIFGLVVSMATIGAAQVRTVTNSTLEKFQQKRLAAERDYRENYARMGFPSPEELDRQRDADLDAKIQLSEQLRQARLEKEKLELELRNYDLNAAALANSYADDDSEGYYGGYYVGSGGYYGGRFGRQWQNRSRRFFNGGGYRATPVGVYPTGTPRLSRLVVGGGTRGGAIIRTRRH